jgi:hypothetical protein
MPSSGSPVTPEYNCSRPLVEKPALRRAEQQSTIRSIGVNGMAGFGWLDGVHATNRSPENCLRIEYPRSSHSVFQSPVARLYLSIFAPTEWINTKFPYLAHSQILCSNDVGAVRIVCKNKLVCDPNGLLVVSIWSLPSFVYNPCGHWGACMIAGCRESLEHKLSAKESRVNCGLTLFETPSKNVSANNTSGTIPCIVNGISD